MPFDMIRLALDESVRSYDQDGRLHVKVSHLTKACVNGYHGNEIPGWEELGLDPYRVYYLLRDPVELQKAVDTWNNIPLLDQHIPVTAADAKRERVIGSTGTDALWNDPYIDNSLVFWADPAIILIENNQQRELSSAYRYKPVMTPGVFQGQRYDGVMTQIRANHVALVEDGRVGSDVVVMDSKPKQEMHMKTALSPRAAYVAGSMAAYLTPKLAKDAKLPDLKAILLGATAKNWEKKKPEIEAAIVRATKGILAQDAEVHIHEHLDGAGAEAPDDVAPADPGGAAGAVPGQEDNNVGTDDDLAAKVQQILQQAGVDENDIAIVVHALKQVKQPDPADTGGAAGGGGEAAGAAADTDNIAPSLDKPGLAKGPAMDSKTPVTKVAMDKAIATAVEDAIQKTTDRLNARDAAKTFVRPWVGDIAVAMDSAPEVFKFALEQMGEDVKDIHPSAFKALLSKIPKPGEQQQQRHQHIAMDASGDKAYLDRFPNANRLTKH